MHEEAYCYKEGSLCEELFLQGKSLSLIEFYRDGKLQPDSMDGQNEAIEDPFEAELRQPQAQRVANQLLQCGLRGSKDGEIRKTVPSSMALRIIGTVTPSRTPTKSHKV